jgi:NAD(P)-dependent dehydrogenase (short-subunit alcohol dehydrogenase family)
VLCADVNQNAANETVEIIRQENATANAIRADLTSHDEIRRIVKTCTDLYGRVDVVDYNVGLAHLGGVVELPEEDWDRIFASTKPRWSRSDTSA